MLVALLLAYLQKKEPPKQAGVVPVKLPPHSNLVAAPSGHTGSKSEQIQQKEARPVEHEKALHAPSLSNAPSIPGPPCTSDNSHNADIAAAGK